MSEPSNKRRGIPGGPASVADKRFRRPDVRPGRSRRFNKRILRLIGGGLVLVALVAFGALLSARVVGARLLAVDKVTVRGNQRLSITEINTVLDSVRGQSVLLVDLQQFRAHLLESPWVASVTVRRVLPSTLDVLIVEREPVAIARLNQQLYLVDETGIIIDDYGPQHSALDLPIVDGMGTRDPKGGIVIDPVRAQLVARFLGALSERQELLRSVSQVDVSRDANVAVLLDADSALLYLGDDHFVDRLRTYLEIRQTLAERMNDVDYVDLRFGQKVFFKNRTDRTQGQ